MGDEGGRGERERREGEEGGREGSKGEIREEEEKGEKGGREGEEGGRRKGGREEGTLAQFLSKVDDQSIYHRPHKLPCIACRMLVCIDSTVPFSSKSLCSDLLVYGSTHHVIWWRTFTMEEETWARCE